LQSTEKEPNMGARKNLLQDRIRTHYKDTAPKAAQEKQKNCLSLQAGGGVGTSPKKSFDSESIDVQRKKIRLKRMVLRGKKLSPLYQGKNALTESSTKGGESRFLTR